MNEAQLRTEIVEVGRRLWLRGFVAANDGNISVRLGAGEFLTTPTGVSKGFMTPEMLVKVNDKGEVLSGKSKPSSELKMHLSVYAQRPDVKAVVHAHPPVSTAFAVCGRPLPKYVLPEVLLTIGQIPLTAYGTPSTDEIPQALSKHIADHEAFLLESHGALTLGEDVMTAYYRMETLEHFATIILAAQQLGGERELSQQQVAKLMRIRGQK